MAKNSMTAKDAKTRAIFRPVAIALLDDEEGICQAGYDEMYDLLDDDVKQCVDATDGRFYLKEESAEWLRKGVHKV